jgi:hypothetical protein
MKLPRIYPVHFSFSLCLVFFIVGRFFASCETETNPLVQAALDKQQIVYEAEKRSEMLSWEIHLHTDSILLKQNGLDALYLTASFPLPYSPIKTLTKRIESSGITSSEKKSIQAYLLQYENLQNDVIQRSNERIKEAQITFYHEKSRLTTRLNRQEITMVQYDNLITNLRETILKDLRHRYNESRIFTTSSVNLQHVLSDIHLQLSSKSWDRLRSALLEK